ncbi:MAG: dTDP-rhamnosyl transferase RfbF [Rhodanobacteraceae bacterium]|jgi:rhamnosyltransferase|nr:MAG: dTDP-rhamnosyl transferase RfbF [Rhodanobacteraceae bacterium]
MSDACGPREAGVCAVLVTHRPDLAVLADQLDALAAQVGHVVLVDNASPDPHFRDFCAAHPEVASLALPENRGLASALNEGIRHARGVSGTTHVLLMDQDSVPEPGMVAALWAALERAANERVAAVGPCFRDAREGADAPFVRIRFPFNRKLRCDGRCTEICCDFLISSGCLIPLAVLDDVGGMDDRLFIDNVDLDWCFRASAAGYALHGVCAARLRHRLGDARRHVPGFPRGIVVHPPRRLFYMMRNRVLLYRRRYTPRRWVAQDIPRLVVKLLLFSLLVPPRAKNLRCMLAGLRAGIAGRAAPPPADA